MQTPQREPDLRSADFKGWQIAKSVYLYQAGAKVGYAWRDNLHLWHAVVGYLTVNNPTHATGQTMREAITGATETEAPA